MTTGRINQITILLSGPGRALARDGGRHSSRPSFSLPPSAFLSSQTETGDTNKVSDGRLTSTDPEAPRVEDPPQNVRRRSPRQATERGVARQPTG